MFAKQSAFSSARPFEKSGKVMTKNSMRVGFTSSLGCFLVWFFSHCDGNSCRKRDLSQVNLANPECVHFWQSLAVAPCFAAGATYARKQSSNRLLTRLSSFCNSSCKRLCPTTSVVLRCARYHTVNRLPSQLTFPMQLFLQVVVPRCTDAAAALPRACM